MELLIFTNNRQLAGVVESYEYLRWTRRYTRAGTFEILAIATPENLALLKEGNILYKSNDEEAGVIERVELSQTDREIITASGRFATSFLARRIIWGTETLRGDVSAAVSQLMTRHLISPTDTARKISGFAYSAPTLGVDISTQTSYRNLLESVSDLCDTADVGLKTTFNPATGLFTVILYAGGTVSAVFSKEYENLTEQTYIGSVDEYANTALVGGEGEGATRQFVTISQGTGENRREVFVDARDLQSSDFPTGYTDALAFRGHSRLSELAPRYSFDAGVNPHGNLRYKADFDLGNMVKVISKPWGVTMTARITEIEETYDRDGLSLQLTFGKSELTITQKMRSDMSGMKTSILAPAGGGGSGEIPDASVTAVKIANNAVTTDKIAAGAVGTADLADGAVTLAKINSAALPVADNAYAQRLLTDTYQNGGEVDLNAFMTAGEYTLYSVTAATNFPPGTWTGSGNTPHLIVQRYYSSTAVRQILSKRSSPNDIWTRTSSSATSWTAWHKIPALNDAGEIATANLADLAVTAAKIANSTITSGKIASLAIATANIADLAVTSAKIANSTITSGKIAASGVATTNLASGAVTMAKIASASDTSFSYSTASGVTVNMVNCVCYNTVVHIYIRINITTAIASGGTVMTITSSNFQPPAALSFNALSMQTSTAGFRVNISTSGVITNGNSGATGLGYFDIAVTFSRKN